MIPKVHFCFGTKIQLDEKLTKLWIFIFMSKLTEDFEFWCLKKVWNIFLDKSLSFDTLCISWKYVELSCPSFSFIANPQFDKQTFISFPICLSYQQSFNFLASKLWICTLKEHFISLVILVPFVKLNQLSISLVCLVCQFFSPSFAVFQCSV